MDSLRKNETQELATKPKDRKLVGSKWVFKRKQGTPGMKLQAYEDLELEQLDVKTTFLHGELDELIYMQPPRLWEGIKDDIGFNRSNHDGCVYFKLTKDSMVYLLLYVDDMLVACKERRHLEHIKEMLKVEFEMKDLGSAKRILGMEIERDRGKRVFRIPYASMVGSVMYTMVCSWPDLAYAVSMISNSQLGTQLKGFVDVDYAGNIDTRKSLTGYVFTVFGGAVSWKANLQSVVALSTTS
ncbi:hypothetical protein AAG906_021177 [Vitis piasezkii]